MKFASEKADGAQKRYASQYNLRARNKQFSVGDKGLTLILSSSHKLLKTWTDPANIVKITKPHSALVELEKGSSRELNFNKFRPYIARVNYVGLIIKEDKDFGEIHFAQSKDGSLTPKEIGDHINSFLKSIACKCYDVFSNKTRIAKVEGHSIRVTKDCSPKRLYPYRISIGLQKEVD